MVFGFIISNSRAKLSRKPRKEQQKSSRSRSGASPSSPSHLSEMRWQMSRMAAKLSANYVQRNLLWMRSNAVSKICLVLTLMVPVRGAEPPAQSPSADPARQRREYRDFAMGHDGNGAHG